MSIFNRSKLSNVIVKINNKKIQRTQSVAESLSGELFKLFAVFFSSLTRHSFRKLHDPLHGGSDVRGQLLPQPYFLLFLSVRCRRRNFGAGTSLGRLKYGIKHAILEPKLYIVIRQNVTTLKPADIYQANIIPNECNSLPRLIFHYIG